MAQTAAQKAAAQKAAREKAARDKAARDKANSAPKPTGKPGAMSKDPSTPPTSKRGNWKYKGKWVNKDGLLVDNYGKPLPNQKTPFVPAKENPFAPKAAPPTSGKPPGTKPPGTPPPKKTGKPPVTERIDTGIKKGVEEGVADIRDFNPDTFVTDYKPQFDESMQRSYDTIYNQFDRKNQEIFARQNEQLQQNLVDRGLDPNSPAYQALTKQLADQQTSARQDAQNAAWQAAQGYQQQGFTQATGAALLPGQVNAPLFEMWNQGQQLDQQTQERLGGQAFTAEQAELQRKWEAERQRLEYEYQVQLKKTRPGGGGGGGTNTAAADAAWANYNMNRFGNNPSGSSGSSATNTAIGAVGTGATNAILNRTGR